ncbi:uncharacterized protein LOC128554653 isoform X2 [Mercenaria mercenaria]|uniref:uncharacterized protein LOC128554653 isoform X2 n=1 Tax=Mercenaria mercenaria TaxID=6596 RepID=UPI00234E9646|nr:uncharacterized protein LOC128554653 isoform X2 [Mercenaria mercenaria]
MILPTKSVSVIGIGILFSLVDSAQITCDDTTPAVGSTLKCECTDLSGYGVDWWKGNSIISTCSSNPKIGCDSPPTGYEFQVNSTSKYFMEINSYTYLNCDRYKCSDLLGSSTSSALDISISNTTLDLTQKVELTETNTTGNITILTGCLFISTENVQKRIQTKWYKILNDSIKAFPGNSTAVFEDTCHECNGVRARQLKVILFYTESEESLNNEKERVQLMLQIYDENDPSNSQNINTSNKYIISGNTDSVQTITAVSIAEKTISTPYSMPPTSDTNQSHHPTGISSTPVWQESSYVTTAQNKDNKSNQSFKAMYMYIALGVFVFIFLLVMLLYCLCLKRKEKEHENRAV